MPDEEKLKLGKGAAFVKGRIKALPPSGEVWEADFEALPRPIEQSGTPYLGMVVTEGDGSLLADTTVHGRPSVNDLATMLAHAMRRPLDEHARRPRLVRLRGHHQWRELFPHLEEIGVRVEVLVGQDLPGIMKAYSRHLRQLQDEHRVGMLQPTSQQDQVEAMFPAIARYVRRHGTIEIGQDEMIGFVVRAIGDGGTAVEDDRPETLAEAMVVLEAGLARWFEEQGVEIE